MVKYLTFDAKRFLSDYYKRKCLLPNEIQENIINKLTQKEKDVIVAHFVTRNMECVCNKYNIGIKRLAEIRYEGEDRLKAYVDSNIKIKDILNYYDFDIKRFLKVVPNESDCKDIFEEAIHILGELEKDVLYESYFEKKKQKKIAMQLCYSEQHIHRVKKVAEEKLKGFFMGKYIPNKIDYNITLEENLRGII